MLKYGLPVFSPIWLILLVKEKYDILKRFLKINFIDNSGRLDTSRIGQVVGLIGISVVSWTALLRFIARDYEGVMNLAVLSALSIGPMALYRVKNYLGEYLYLSITEEEMPEDRFRIRSFIKRNILDSRLRLNTGRIGQIQGIVILSVAMTIAVYRVVFRSEKVPDEVLSLLLADSGAPMLLYQLKKVLDSVVVRRAELPNTESVEVKKTTKGGKKTNVQAGKQDN